MRIRFRRPFSGVRAQLAALDRHESHARPGAGGQQGPGPRPGRGRDGQPDSNAVEEEGCLKKSRPQKAAIFSVRQGLNGSFDERFHLRLGLAADDLVHGLAVLEQNERGDGHDAVAACHFWIVINVDLPSSTHGFFNTR